MSLPTTANNLPDTPLVRHPPPFTMATAIDPSPPRHAASAHPRRSHADDSVSLLHRPRKRVKRNDEDLTTRPAAPGPRREESGSPSSLRPLIGRDSSGESSNVDNWFETANNGVRQNGNAIPDNDPPFFLRNASSSDSPHTRPAPIPDAAPRSHHLDLIRSPRTHLRMHLDSSGIDDFRSVIDDLTVENKQLKSRLRRYENVYAPHLDHDRLFEVRVHGLPPEKKHELEDTLRKFTAGLTNVKREPFPSNGYEGLAPVAPKNDATNDSAYASASASGQGSTSRSDGKQSRSLRTVASRQRNIQSYLHDIPEGLMPTREPAELSDGMRKRVVVRRLEQLFAGKGAVGDAPQQSMQQQEVSQSAARADRFRLEAAGGLARQEGNRESLIMDQDTEQNGEAVGAAADGRAVVNPGIVQQQDFANPRAVPTALDQRPTRPLDLDPYRAQVPTDNIRYMRHLGFSPLDPELLPADEDHGWVYLNFLINMAQLHTINVTAEFVRQAVEAHSDRLEVSPDGRKLRWKGHAGLTKLSNSTDGSQSGSPASHLPLASPGKKPKLTHRSSRSTVPTVPDPSESRRYEPSKYAYLSGYQRRSRLDSQEGSSSEADDDSAFFQDVGIRSSSGKRPSQNDGPIIFYNNARFYTDLSGTRGPAVAQDVPAYMTLGTEPLGKPKELADPSREKRGPLSDIQQMQHCMSGNDRWAQAASSRDVSFPGTSPATSPILDAKAPLELEVTGMGGIWPSDHFSIDVRTQYVPKTGHLRSDKPTVAGCLPPRIARALGASPGRRARTTLVRSRTLSTRKKALPPSQLPPTLGYMAFGSSSPEDEEMDEEVITDIDQLTSVRTPSTGAAVLRPTLGMPFGESDDKDASSEEDGESDDGDGDDDDDYDDDDDDVDSQASLDLLAAARAVDPEAVRAREREYDANMAERLAEEIPAGSSAATAGGGSGFASPASGVDDDEHRRARRAARKQQQAAAVAAAVKHARTPRGLGGQEDARSSGGEEERSDIGS